jgi:hypothetical protein
MKGIPVGYLFQCSESLGKRSTAGNGILLIYKYKIINPAFQDAGFRNIFLDL